MKIKAILFTVTIASVCLCLTACKPTDDHSGHDHSGDEHDEHTALENEHDVQTEHIHDQNNEGDHEEHATKTPGPNGGTMLARKATRFDSASQHMLNRLHRVGSRDHIHQPRI